MLAADVNVELQSEGFRRRFVEGYVQGARQYAAAMNRAIDQRTREAARQNAHALKGSSITIGAQRVVARCRRLEALIEAGDWRALQEQRRALDREIDAAAAALQTLSAEPRAAAS